MANAADIKRAAIELMNETRSVVFEMADGSRTGTPSHANEEIFANGFAEGGQALIDALDRTGAFAALDRARALYIKASTQRARDAIAHAEEMADKWRARGTSSKRQARAEETVRRWERSVQDYREHLERQEAAYGEIFDQVTSGALDP